MARPPKRERRPADLRCNNCGNEFEGRAWFVSVESSDRGAIGWNPDTDGARGERCPACGSDLLGVRGR